MNKLVTIIVPCFNCEKYIDRCLKSIEMLTFSDYEVILVDDGSTDRTGELLDKYIGSKNEEHIKVIHTTNRGVSAARNLGLRTAKGKYIAFIDADDWVSSAWLSILVEGYQYGEKDVDLVGCNFIYRDAYSEMESAIVSMYTEIEGRNELLKYLFKHPEMSKVGLMGRPFIWNKLYRRDIIDKFEVKFDENLSIGEDYRFNYDYIRHCKLARFNKSQIYNYFQNNDSTMSTFRMSGGFTPKMIGWALGSEKLYEDVLKEFVEVAKCCETMSVRLYISCLVRMICANVDNDDFRKSAVHFIRRHNYNRKYDANGSLKYLMSAIAVRINYDFFKTLIQIIRKI